MSIEILEEELATISVFKDRSKLSIDYVPFRLPHREKEYRMLVHYFRPVLESRGKVSSRALIRGKVGTGKTALAKRFGYDFEVLAQNRGVNVCYKHVNCREDGSFFNILSNILRSFERSFPRRGFSSEELLQALLSVLKMKNTHLILALDELESLIRREGSYPLYNLLRAQEAIEGVRISIICILREPECELIMDSIDESTWSTIEPNTIYLKQYTAEQLKEILLERVEEAFKEGVVKMETIDLISLIAGERGDARYAIELLERAGIYADMERSSYVLPSHVRRARLSLPFELREETIRLLNIHEKLILLALARELEREDVDCISMGELRRQYCVVCEEYGKKSLGYTRFYELLKELLDLGIIIAKKSGKGFRGRTTFIGLSFPPKDFRIELEKIIK